MIVVKQSGHLEHTGCWTFVCVLPTFLLDPEELDLGELICPELEEELGFYKNKLL